MGEVTAEDATKAVAEREAARAKIDAAIVALTKDNRGRDADIAMYAHAFVDYETAQANIAEHGAIVFHPRTGEPIENPYLKIRDRAGVTMRKLELRDGALWKREEPKAAKKKRL